MITLDLNTAELAAIGDEFEASEKDVRLAYRRALQRTAKTLGAMARKGLRSELQLRQVKAIQNRLKVNKSNGRQASVWFGTDPLPVSAFKGRPTKTAEGMSFRGKKFDAAFQARLGKKKSVYQRLGKKRFPIKEARLPIDDQLNGYVEKELFAEIDEIFFKHFRADLKARTIYGVGGGR